MSEKTTRVYKYGLRVPHYFDTNHLAELERMNALWNKLVEIDRDRERQFKELCARTFPEYAKAVATIDALQEPINDVYDRIRAERVKFKSIHVSEDLASEKERLLERRRAAYEVCKAIHKKLPKELAQPINETAKANAKLARQQSGCFWGNYNAVIQSFEVAKSKAIKDGARLQFKRFEGEGRFVNQIIGGMTPEQLLAGSHSQVKLGPVIGQNRNGEKRDLTFTAFTGRDAEGKHTRTEITCKMAYHRPFPAGSVIKAVEVVRKRLNGTNRFKWHACFTVSIEEEKKNHPSTAVVGINLGWRQIGSQLRVAMAVNSKGKKTELLLPAKLVKKFETAEALESECATKAVEKMHWLRQLYHECGDQFGQDWKDAATSVLKSPKPSMERLEVLSERFLEIDDKDAATEFNTWLHEHRKAVASYIGCRRNAVKWREEIYRCWAAKIAKENYLLSVTDTPLAKMSRTKGGDGLAVENALPESARRNRVIAGVYTLKEWLEKQAKKQGGMMEVIKGKVTQSCCQCLELHEKPINGNQYYTCVHCGAENDVDINAATNCRNLASGEVVETKKQSSGGRFQRAKEGARKSGNDNMEKAA